MEGEILEIVLQEIAQELKAQKEQMALLHQALEKQHKIVQRIEEKILKLPTSPSELSTDGTAAIKEAITGNFEVLRAEMFRRPTINATHKHYSVLPASFRMEHFPMLVNTIMKWVVTLISLVFAMWLILGIANR